MVVRVYLVTYPICITYLKCKWRSVDDTFINYQCRYSIIVEPTDIAKYIFYIKWKSIATRMQHIAYFPQESI